RALLLKSADPPDVTAVLAATVAEVYDTLRSMIECEIGSDEADTELRGMVLAALEDRDYWTEVNGALPPDEEPDVPPPVTCGDFDEWEVLIEALETDILEDYDFDMEDSFMDADPARSAALKDQL